MNKIGIVLVTCNRPAFFEKSIIALPKADKMIVINDGRKISESLVPTYFDKFIQHKKNIYFFADYFGGLLRFANI